MVPSPQRPSLTTPAHTKIPGTTFFFAPSYIPPRTPASPPQARISCDRTRAVTERSAALSNGAGSVPLLFQASSMEGTRSGRRAGARVALSVLSGVSREADESVVFVVDRLSVCPVCRLFRL